MTLINIEFQQAKSALTVLAWMVAITGVSADLVEQDLSVPGDRLVTLDTSTGMSWLDLTVTLNEAYSSPTIMAWYDLGWRHATTEEVIYLWSQFGITHGDTPPPGGYGELASFENMFALMGKTVDPGDIYYGSHGITVGGWDASASVWYGSNETSADATNLQTFSAREDMGHHLVTSGVIAADSDSDGVFDWTDNCLQSANVNQRDTDGDGYGNACDADFDQNCVVNVVDLGIMKAFFFLAGDFDADLNGDGVINVIDLGIMKAGFFLPPGPSADTSLCAP